MRFVAARMRATHPAMSIILAAEAVTFAVIIRIAQALFIKTLEG